MIARRTAAILIGALLLNACNVGPDFTPPDPGLSLASFFGSTSRAQDDWASWRAPDPTWWKAFRDPQLTSLEKRVATANLDLKTATLRIAESRFQRGSIASAEYPTLDGTGKYQREQYSDNGIASLLGALAPAGAGPTKIAPINDFTTGFDASWEVDIWGRVRRQAEAADAMIEVNEEQRRDALVSTLAEVARDYIQLRGAQALLANADDNVKIAHDLLDLTRTRQEKGLTTGLDVENASAQVDAVLADIPAYRQQESQQINALSFLLDLPPNGLRGELARARGVPPSPARVPIGIPSQLARRRPDIRRAEAQLHAQTADIGVAVASFYPSFQLNGTLDLDSLTLQNLFKASSLQYVAGPTLTLPIFEGGKLKSMLELSKAQQQEAAIAYSKTVLQAWHDIANALVAYRTEQERRDRLASQVDHSEQALTLARARYSDGVADFTTVLDTARTMLEAKQQYVQSTVNVSTDLVQLYKALGGGWESTYPDEKPRAAVAEAKIAQ